MLEPLLRPGRLPDRAVGTGGMGRTGTRPGGSCWSGRRDWSGRCLEANVERRPVRPAMAGVVEILQAESVAVPCLEVNGLAAAAGESSPARRVLPHRLQAVRKARECRQPGDVHGIGRCDVDLAGRAVPGVDLASVGSFVARGVSPDRRRVPGLELIVGFLRGRPNIVDRSLPLGCDRRRGGVQERRVAGTSAQAWCRCDRDAQPPAHDCRGARCPGVGPSPRQWARRLPSVSVGTPAGLHGGRVIAGWRAEPRCVALVPGARLERLRKSGGGERVVVLSALARKWLAGRPSSGQPGWRPRRRERLPSPRCSQRRVVARTGWPNRHMRG